jgi:hypothetical protein
MASRSVRFWMSFTMSCMISLNGSFCRIRSALTRTKVTISVAGGLRLQVEQPALDPDDPVPHLLKGFLHLPLGECLLLPR